MAATMLETLPLTVTHLVSEPFSMPSAHLHDFCELLFVVRGHITVESNAKMYEYDAPAILVFNNYNIHRNCTHSGELYERYLIYYDQEVLYKYSTREEIQKFFEDTNLIALSLEESQCNILMRLVKCFNDFEEVSEGRNLLTMLMLQKIYDWYTAENGVRVVPSNPYIKEVIDYAVKNFSTDLTLDSIAAHFFTSRSKLVSDFKKATGITLIKYIMLIRLHTARNYLRQHHSISQTAFLCGFHSESYFISQFSKHFGVTPRVYQKACMNEERNKKHL